jgi:hypothetical protein
LASNHGESLLEQGMRRPEHVVVRAFGGETIVLNLKTGMYHGLNPVGGAMLEALEHAPSVAAAAEELAEGHGWPLENVLRDLTDQCDQLLDRGLIESRNDGRG